MNTDRRTFLKIAPAAALVASAAEQPVSAPAEGTRQKKEQLSEGEPARPLVNYVNVLQGTDSHGNFFAWEYSADRGASVWNGALDAPEYRP